MAVFDIFDPLRDVIPRFTEEQLKEIIKYFDENAKPLLVVNDGEPINVISIENLIGFLQLKKFHRRSFYYPTYADIMIQVEYLKAGVRRIITKEQFIYILNKWVLETNLRHELELAFKVFDTEKRNYLEIDEIKTIVTSYADAYDAAETQELLRDANVRGDGNVFYMDFIETLFSVAPELNNIKVDYLYQNPEEDPSVEPEPIPEPEPVLPPPLPPPFPPPPPPLPPKKKKK